MTQL
jgi:hypothetical protein